MAFDALMILGPTASGKTALALELARRLPAEIVSIDSALVYRGMDVGTAKPTRGERLAVVHHLIDIRDIGEPYSVADFFADVCRLVPEIRARGRLPVLAGGTMLYANALLRGLSDLPGTDPQVRGEVLREGARRGWEAMHAELARVDPAAAARLKPLDSQRISRALELYRMTGRTMTELLTEHPPKKAPFSFFTAALIPSDRAWLHERIARRFDAMLAGGFLQEVKRLTALPGFDPDSPAMRSVGYRQALEFLRGGVSERQFREKAVAATRQLAKRQITWLRSMPVSAVFDPCVKESGREAAAMLAGQPWGLPAAAVKEKPKAL